MIMKLRERMYTWIDVKNEGYNPVYYNNGSPIEPRENKEEDFDQHLSDDIPILDHDKETPESDDDNPESDNPMDITEGYNPEYAAAGSPVSKFRNKEFDFEKHDAADTILDTENEPSDEAEENPDHKDPQVSDILAYYNETALKSKQRNALPDEVFGLPRLRAYPLNDKAHVQQAIRMFGHCKDPKDRKILANNIFAAMKKFNVTTKIGKGNALYEYAPEALREAHEYPKFMGLGVPLSQRTEQDIKEEHIRINRNYYNTLFYSTEFTRSIKALKEYEFLDYFHPDMRRMDFSTRLRSVCGGLASEDCAESIYRRLHMREPLCMDFNVPIGWPSDDLDSDELRLELSDINYTPEDNWFHVSLARDINHTVYCLKLYSILSEIVLDPNFNQEVSLTPQQHGILMDWKQHVQYHYDLYKEAKPDSQEQTRQMQYLWDLYWSCTDNPEDEMCISANIISMVDGMASARNLVGNVNEANIPGEILSREQCSAYLAKELGMPDSIFLLPLTMQYPIVDKTSVRMAMDMISQVPEEDRVEYVKNLNRKYKEFGCNFSISVDHPYAPYADKNIIEHMSHLLLEGDTAVDDEGTSTNSEKPSVENPWYKRLDVIRGLDTNVLDNKELGPNTKKQQEPDYTPHDSIL